MSNPMTPPHRPQATKGFVRILGAILLLGGIVMVYVGKGWYVDGLIPMPWFGAFFIGFGALMEVAPSRFQQRAGRFHQIADQLSKKA